MINEIGTENGPPHGLHQRIQRVPEQETSALEPAVMELSRLMFHISTELRSQQDAVQFIADAAVESRENVRRGTRELDKTLERPSIMKEFILIFILVMMVLLLFLDWYSP